MEIMATRRKLSPRKLPSQERSRATVEAILQATTYILVKRGHEALTTNLVAARAGVNIATLYQYFPNKESLVAELLRRHVAETRAASLSVLAEARPGRGLAATVRAMVEALIAAHKVEPVLHRIFTQLAMQGGGARFETASDAPLQHLGRGWLGGTSRDPELTMWIAYTAAHSVLHLALLERPHVIDQPAFANELARLVTRYLRR